jgi:hypothetical protein
VALVAALPLAALAASPAKTEKEPAKVVELFDGIKAGDIEVKVIPKDAKEGSVLITNKTGKPLTIKVPEALAGVPVLAQGLGLGGAGGGLNGGNQGGYGGGGGNQGFGGGMMGGMGGMGGMGMGGMGMGGMGMGGGMGGMGGGFFSVPAEPIAKKKLN